MVIEVRVDVPCDAERGDNEPCLSLPHSLLPNTSALSLPSNSLIVLHQQH